MKIRKATKDDLNDLAELDKQFWKVHSGIDPFIEPAKKLTMKNHFKHARKIINNKKKNDFYFVCEINDKVIAALNFQIQKNESFFKVKKYGYLDSITVHKDYRKKGIARALTNFALNFLKKKGIKYVKFHTNWENKNAINAFKKMNFKEKNIMFYKRVR